MTTVVVLADAPPSVGPLEAFVPDPLSTDEATALYRAMLADVCEVVQEGQADLLVNYRTENDRSEGDAAGGNGSEDESPDTSETTETAETALQELFDGELPEPDAVRYEPQVGTSKAARVGNALTHLLDEEGEASVAVVAPTAPFLRREHIGTAAMKIRTSDVVLGPAPGGRVTFAGFREPIDFTEIYTTPALETFTRRGVEAGLDVDFLPMMPLLETPADLPTVVSVLSARRAAGRLVPPRTTARLEEWGFAVEADGRVSRSDNS